MFGKFYFGNSFKGVDEFKILLGQGKYYGFCFIINMGDMIIKGYIMDIIIDFIFDWMDNCCDLDCFFMLMYLYKVFYCEWLFLQCYYEEYLKKIFLELEIFFDDYEGWEVV